MDLVNGVPSLSLPFFGSRKRWPFATLERMGKSKINVKCCLQHHHHAHGAARVASAQTGCYCSGKLSTLPYTPCSSPNQHLLARMEGLRWAHLVPRRPQLAHSPGHGCHCGDQSQKGSRSTSDGLQISHSQRGLSETIVTCIIQARSWLGLETFVSG